MPRKPEIIFEDDDVIVINKPAGLLTSTVPNEKRPTAIAFLREHAARSDRKARVGVIHRLDRDASGLLVFSKNREAFEDLKNQFFHHKVKRVYAAVVMGAPKPTEGTIRSRLVEFADGTVHSTKREGAGELAITHYKTIRSSDSHSLLRVRLETGKKHQIRVHLSDRGWPIVNDVLYAKSKPVGDLMLTAIELEFAHPRKGKKMEYTIPIPGAMTGLFRAG